MADDTTNTLQNYSGLFNPGNMLLGNMMNYMPPAAMPMTDTSRKDLQQHLGQFQMNTLAHMLHQNGPMSAAGDALTNIGNVISNIAPGANPAMAETLMRGAQVRKQQREQDLTTQFNALRSVSDLAQDPQVTKDFLSYRLGVAKALTGQGTAEATAADKAARTQIMQQHQKLREDTLANLERHQKVLEPSQQALNESNAAYKAEATKWLGPQAESLIQSRHDANTRGMLAMALQKQLREKDQYLREHSDDEKAWNDYNRLNQQYQIAVMNRDRAASQFNALNHRMLGSVDTNGQPKFQQVDAQGHPTGKSMAEYDIPLIGQAQESPEEYQQRLDDWQAGGAVGDAPQPASGFQPTPQPQTAAQAQQHPMMPHVQTLAQILAGVHQQTGKTPAPNELKLIGNTYKKMMIDVQDGSADLNTAMGEFTNGILKHYGGGKKKVGA